VTPEGFAEALGWELLCRGVSYDPAEVLGFVRDVWPFVRECPDPERWATLFVTARRLDRVLGRRGG
jgi:hypothetical protein